MNKVSNIIIISLFFLLIGKLNAQESISKENSRIDVSLELSTKYVWRGLEYGSSPIVFPKLAYLNKGFNAFVMGGYTFNNSHEEVDLGASYSLKGFTVGLSDYYYPTAVNQVDQYFDYASRTTRHSVEMYGIFSSVKIPFWVIASCYIFGNDKNLEGGQAYSSYLELGYVYTINDNSNCTLTLGANLNKGFYTNYIGGFNIVNINFSYFTKIPIYKFYLPISVSWIINPYKEKTYITFSSYFTF